MLNFKTIFGSCRCQTNSHKKPMSAADQIAQVFVDALGKVAPELAGLSHEMNPLGLDLMHAVAKACRIAGEVKAGRLLHLAGEAFDAKEFKKAAALLRKAAAKYRNASKPDYNEYNKPAIIADLAAKRELATSVEDLAEKIEALEALKGLDGGLVEAEVLVAACEEAQALEATIGAKIKALLDAIVAGLKGRWGKKGDAAHKAIESFLIKGEEPKLVGVAKKERLFELGERKVYCRKRGCYKRVAVAARFVLPRSLNDKDNGAVGVNAVVYEQVDGEWVPIAGSPVNKSLGATLDLYRLVDAAVNKRDDIREYIRELLLGRFGATSPWHEALSAGKYKVVTLGHEQEDGALGFVLYQLATVVDEDMMTPELAETMAKIKASMTAGAQSGEAPRYFTIAMKSESGESGTERQPEGDEAPGSERQGDERDEADESEVVGRLASVSASSSSRKRKSIESVESGAAKPVDELDEAIEKAMESGRAGLAENADDATRVAFFVRGSERINGPGGLAEQIQAKAGEAGEAGEAGGSRQLSLSCDALSMELHELEEKRGNLRVAMQEAVACFDARKYATLFGPEQTKKRQRSSVA